MRLFKYIIISILMLCFIVPALGNNKSVSQIMSNGVYNYITSVERSVNYLTSNIPFFCKISDISYQRTYNNIMEDRTLEKHLVAYGETLDDIIKIYNTNIKNIKDFRRVVYEENNNLVSNNYQIKSGDYLLIPSEK